MATRTAAELREETAREYDAFLAPGPGTTDVSASA